MHAGVAYTLAAVIGLLQALAIFPVAFLLPGAGGDAALLGDAAQHAIAQRYFIADAWRWPPLHIAILNQPEGMNLAFADGIPLLALPLKLLAPWLPDGFHGIGLWYAIATLLQPVAAVWALRSAGERRLLPALGIALAALAMPAWLARYGHAALTGHFLLLGMLGLYLRLARRQHIGLWVATGALLVCSLLVHPYLAAMALGIAAAVPLTLFLRGDRGWRAALGGVALSAGAVLLCMAMLGYFGASGDGGYGRYALNLLSPVWPYRSALLPGLAVREIDATGHGGWEGYNWLGAGLLVGLLLAALLRPRCILAVVVRHGGLALALLGFTLLAISHRVGAGASIILDLGAVPAVMEQFRASGRFFWPVSYALLLGAMVVLARSVAAGPVLVAVLGLVQFIDATPIRADLAAWAAARPGWMLDAKALRPLMSQASRLTLLPSWHCIAARDAAAFMLAHEALALASETALPVNTMHVARWRSPPRCDDAALAAAPLAPGELRLILPAALPEALMLVPQAATHCQSIGDALACRRDDATGATGR